jgi:hypothetical protein
VIPFVKQFPPTCKCYKASTNTAWNHGNASTFINYYRTNLRRNYLLSIIVWIRGSQFQGLLILWAVRPESSVSNLCIALPIVNYTNYTPVAVRSTAQVCGRLIAGIAGSNPAEGMDVLLLLFVCFVGNGLCDGLITRAEEAYRVCMSNCVWSRNLNNEVAYARFGLYIYIYIYIYKMVVNLFTGAHMQQRLRTE